MAIKLNTTDPVKIRLTFKSLQVIGYLINIEDDQINTIEKFIGDNKNNNWKDIDLSTSPKKLSGNFLQSFFSIIDPVGKDNEFLFTLEIFQSGKSVFSKEIKGTTNDEIIRKTFREKFTI